MLNISSLFNTSSNMNSLISQLMALERQPIIRLEASRADLNVKTAMLSDLKSKLSGLGTAAAELAETGSASIFNTARQAATSDAELITATAGSNAAIGTYLFRITQLATSTSMKSTGALNTKPSRKSSAEVVAGSGTIDTTKSFAEAGFENTPDGTVTIRGETFTLSEYSTVDDFMTAVNDDANAKANIYYDSIRDKFATESDDATSLTISETGTYGFFTEVNISTGTDITTNESGIQGDVLLYKTNLDTGVSSDDSGSFEINGATMEWDADVDTLNDVISRINSSTAGVTAFYDDTNDKVTITSNTTGSEEIVFSGTFLENTLKFSGVTQDVGKDAKFTINSTSSDDEIVKSSNTFDINGTTFTLHQAHGATYQESIYDTVTVTRDDSAIQSKINSFLSQFNTTMSYIKTKSATDPTTYTRGGLAGNSLYTSLRSSLFKIMIDAVSGIAEGKPDSLRDIGITFDADFQVSLSDASKLSDELASDPQAVADIFNDAENGIATRIENLLEPYTENYGIVDDTKDSISDQIESIDARIERLNERLDRREEQLRKELASMQQTLALLTRQSTMIQSFYSSTSSYYGGGSILNSQM